MKKKWNVLLAVCIFAVMTLYLTGCGSGNNTAMTDENATAAENPDNEGKENTSDESAAKTDNTEMNREKAEKDTDSEEAKQGKMIDVADLKFSEGLEFESNGDGTCTLIGIGICKDTDLVIPEKSPAGDTITLIQEYAFYSLEDIESVTLVNGNYEVDKYAFQYGEFTTLNILGGNPIFKESVFSACEDLTSILISNCNIQADKYSFFSCGKDAELTFSNCTGFLDEYAFQYSDLVSLTMDNCDIEIDKSVFSACEELTSISFSNSTIQTDEYAFFSCGDKADVEMNNCMISLGKMAFQYSSLNTLTITGSELKMEDSTFSGCEDLTTVKIDCPSVFLGEYAFFSCDDLVSVSICENNASDNQIEIDDMAFQYCEKLENVVIGNGSITTGKYSFFGCADNLILTIAGNVYTAGSLDDGLSL